MPTTKSERHKILDVPKGAVVFREGEVTGHAYLIQSGRVEVSKQDAGRTFVLARLGPGQYIGEMGLILESPHSATVVAIEDCVLRPISREIFNRFLKKDPASVMPLIKVLFERLRVMNLKYVHALEGMGNGQGVKAAAAVEGSGQAAPMEPAPAGGVGGTLYLTGETDQAQRLVGRGGRAIAKFPYRIGRKVGSFFADAFSLNDLHVPDEQPFQVSRNHCAIDVAPDGSYLVLDRGSRLGTVVNGEKIGFGTGRVEARLAARSNILVLGHHDSPFKFRLIFK